MIGRAISSAASIMDPRIIFWTQGNAVKNFGDFLTIMLADRAFIAPLFPASRYRLIGSAIDDAVLGADLAQLDHSDELIACWGCGARSNASLSKAIMERVRLFGVRGPLSRNALGLPINTPLGDPGLLVPLLYKPRPCSSVSGKVLCVPHFHEPLSSTEILSRTGADLIASPRVTSLLDCENLLDQIAGADLVLAGSLHAAILAFAYGRPFAFLDLGFIDIPFKWEDFAALIGIKAKWFSNAREALEFARHCHSIAIQPALLPLLCNAPWAVRPSVLAAAMERDRKLGYEADCRHDDQNFISQVRSRHQEIYCGLQEGGRTAARQLALQTAETAEAAAAEAAVLYNSLVARARAARFCFRDDRGDAAVLTFAQGEAGSSLLAGRWIEPNAIAPISWGNESRIRIPKHYGWHEVGRIIIEGYLFAPPSPPYNGKRQMTVFANGDEVYAEVLCNPSEEESFVARIAIELPSDIRARGGDLELQLNFALQASPREIGLRMDDDRPIGLAPLRMWAEYSVA